MEPDWAPRMPIYPAEWSYQLPRVGASFQWDGDFAVIAEQRGAQIAVQFYPIPRRRKRMPLAPPVDMREMELV